MTARQRILAWIAEHDDSWLFIVFYVGLGLVLSMTISLFWLVAVAWQRTIRSVLMTVDEAAHVVKAVAARNGPRRAQVAEVVDERPPWRRPWSRGDKFAVVFTLTWAALILLAPVLTHHTVDSTLATLAADLHPWPSN